MPGADISREQLNALVGRRVQYLGMTCQVIEALLDGPALVLLRCGGETTIQSNQFGEAWRRAPETYVVPVLNPDKTALAPGFLELGLR